MFSILRQGPSDRPAPPAGGDGFTAYVREELMAIGQEVAELQRALQEAQKLSESKDMLIAELRGELRTLLGEAERLKEAVEDAKKGTNPADFEYNPASYNAANIQRLLAASTTAPAPPPPAQTRQMQQQPPPANNGFMSFFSSEAPETERRNLAGGSAHGANATGPSLLAARVANLRVVGYPHRNEPLRAAAEITGNAVWQWFRKRPDRQDWEPIPGANTSEYVPGMDDLGCSLQVGAQAVGADGSRSELVRCEAGVLPNDNSFETAAMEYWNKGRVDFSTLRAKEAGALVQKTLTLKRDQASLKKTKSAKLGSSSKIPIAYNRCQAQANTANATELALVHDGRRVELVAGNPQERDFILFCFRRFQQLAAGGRR